jgi:GNAT superfamily N-acetyltransferase
MAALKIGDCPFRRAARWIDRGATGGWMMIGRAAELTATSRLRDGRLVSIRRLSADDAEVVVALHQKLTDYERYYRFFSLKQIDLEKMVRTMVEPGDGQCALGAFDGDRLIGAANYTVGDDENVAEIAIVVAHEDHSLGVGTALLKRLAHIARAHGIHHFEADVLAENELMLLVLFDVGWPSRRVNHGSVLHLDIELPESIGEESTADIGLLR